MLDCTLHGDPPRRPLSRSFTLLELAAIGCAVTAALAALMPGLRSTRSQDRLSGCLSNLRAIGAASLSYAAEDPNELLIPLPDFGPLPTVIGEFEWGGKAGRGQQTQPGRIASSIYGTAAWRGLAHRPLNKLLYKDGFIDWNPVDGTAQPGAGESNYINDANRDLDIFRCPSDTGYAGGGYFYTGGPTTTAERTERPFREEGLTAYDHYGTSYHARSLYVWGADPRPKSYSVLFRPLSAVPNPGRTVAYNDVPGRYAWIWGDWSATTCGYADRVVGNFNTIAGWHGRDFKFSVTFADGHAELVEMQGCLRPAPNLGRVNYPSNICPEPNLLYECQRCVTFRGVNWQLDTLPADPVPTAWDSARAADGGSGSPMSGLEVDP